LIEVAKSRGVTGLVTDPGRKKLILCKAGNVPADIETIRTPLAKAAEAAAPVLGDVNTTVDVDRL
jgi:hypothetical protein